MFACAPDDETGPHSAGCLCRTPAFARLNRRLTEKFSPRSLSSGAGAIGMFAAGSGSASARAPAALPASIAFTNVRVFDGKSDALRGGLRVVVEGNAIKTRRILRRRPRRQC